MGPCVAIGECRIELWTYTSLVDCHTSLYGLYQSHHTIVRQQHRGSIAER